MSSPARLGLAGVLVLTTALLGCAAPSPDPSGDPEAATAAPAPGRSTAIPSGQGDLPPRNACPTAAAAPPPVPGPVAGTPPDRVLVVNNKLPAGSPPGTRYTVSVIDPARDTVIATIPVADGPHHIEPVPGENQAYVTSFTGCSMDVIDTGTDQVIGSVRTGFGPRHLSFSGDGHYAYVVNYYGSTISVIDTSTNTTVAEVPTGPYPNYSLPSPDGATVFVVDSGADTLTVADARPPFQVRKTVTVGAAPFNLALTPDGATLVTANSGDDTVSLIDTRTLAVTATIPIRRPGQRDALTPTGTLTQKLNVRIAPGGRYAWVGDQLGADWAVIDLSTRSLNATYPAGAGSDILFPIRRGPMAGLALGTARYAAQLAVLNPDQPAIRGSVVTVPDPAADSAGLAVFTGSTGPPGAGSHVAVFNQAQTTAYVTDRPGGSVSVLDLTTGHPTLTATIPVGMFPDGITYLRFDNGTATAGTQH